MEFLALAPEPGADRLADMKFTSVKSILAFAIFGGPGGLRRTNLKSLL